MILAPSFNLSPVALVFPYLSLPAKSTKFMTDNLEVFVPYKRVIYLNSIVIMVWALELV